MYHLPNIPTIYDSVVQKPFGYYESKGSKFLVYMFSVSVLPQHQDILTHFKQQKANIIHLLRQEHKKAVHFVEAFRILNAYNHIVEGSHDDGEPKGSSGMPMLEVLRGEQIINILCVCVRYFGGTKLGVGGLVRAYTQAILNACTTLKNDGLLIEYHAHSFLDLEDKSSQYNYITHLIKQYHLEIVSKTFCESHVKLTIKGKDRHIQAFLQQYKSTNYTIS